MLQIIYDLYHEALKRFHLQAHKTYCNLNCSLTRNGSGHLSLRSTVLGGIAFSRFFFFFLIAFAKTFYFFLLQLEKSHLQSLIRMTQVTIRLSSDCYEK